MDVKKLLEYPLPIINKEQSKIVIEISNTHEGSLTIKNDGGGILEGRITSNSYFLTFESEYFKGNSIKINYSINLNVYNTDEILHTDAIIMSNGGEHKIEFLIKVVPHVINTKEGEKITTLKDFLSFSKAHPIAARQLFSSYDFMMWLYMTQYEYMDLYEQFISDSNKERGLNNFFIFNKLRHKVSLNIIPEDTVISVNPYNNEIYKGIISIKRSGQGFIEDKLYIKNKVNWLNLEKDKITSSNFKTNDVLEIVYEVDKELINKKVENEVVLLQNGAGNFKITVKKLNFLDAKLEKSYIEIKDTGILSITSNVEEAVEIEITAKDKFLKFENETYKINKHRKILFNVKLSKLQLAQKSIKKTPVLKTEIYIKSYFKGESYLKTLTLTIGSFK